MRTRRNAAVAWVGLAAAVSLLFAALAAAQAPVNYRTVALSSQQAPDAPAGFVYRSFGAGPVLNDVGGIGFVASMGLPTGADLGRAIFAGTDAAPHLVARESDAAPGTPPGTSYGRFDGSFPALSNSGQIVFDSILAGPSIPAGDTGVFSGSTGPGGSVQLITRTNEHPAGTAPGAFYTSVGRPNLGNGGQVAFGGFTRGGERPDEAGIWAGPAGAPQLLVRQNDPAPGTAAGVTYLTLEGGVPVVDNAGRVAYSAGLAGPGVTPANQNAIFAGVPGAVQLLARGGTQAPGAPAGVVYDAFDNPTLSDNGRVAYIASLAGAGVTGRNIGIFTGPPAAAAGGHLVARMGDSVPGAAGLTYADFSSIIDVNNVGQTAFNSKLAGAGVTSANDAALVVAAAGGPATIIAREGDPAPGAPAGVHYGAGIGPADLNNLGQVAYTALLAGDGVTTTNGSGLFLYDPALGPTLLARAGDPFDVGGGDLRIIAANGIGLLAPAANNTTSGLGDDGRLGFVLRFTDGSSGVFVAAVVPEPAALALLCLCATPLLRRRTRCRANAR